MQFLHGLLACAYDDLEELFGALWVPAAEFRRSFSSEGRDGHAVTDSVMHLPGDAQPLSRRRLVDREAMSCERRLLFVAGCFASLFVFAARDADKRCEHRG